MKKQQFYAADKKFKAAEKTIKTVKRSGLANIHSGKFNPKAETTEFTFELPGVHAGKTAGVRQALQSLSFPGSGHHTVIGAPDVPQEGLFIAIPLNAEGVDVRVKEKKSSTIRGKFQLAPVPKPVKEKEYLENGFEYSYNEKIFSQNADYPGKLFDYIGIKEIDGIRVAHIIVYPVQYNPAKGSVTVVSSITFTVRYSLKGKPKNYEVSKAMLPIHGNSIVDFEHVFPETGFPFDPVKERGKYLDDLKVEFTRDRVITFPYEMPEKFRQPFYFGLKSAYHYSRLLIITTPALVKAVEPYRLAKLHAPYNAVTITTDSIVSAFPATDLKTSIKNFLSYAYDHWVVRPQFVVLATDTDIIPMHVYHRSDDYPSDHYYADINGDMCPELIVSRFPSSDYETLLRISNFCAGYVETRGADWQGSWLGKAVLVAYEADTYKNCMNDVYDAIHDRFSATKLYGDSSTETDVKNNINAGDLIVHYRGHGSETAWASANGLNTTDIDALSDGQTPPYVFNICCENGAAQSNSHEVVVEAWIRNQKAIATMGATRDSWTSINNNFSQYLWEAIMDDAQTVSGYIFQVGKTKLVLNDGSDYAIDNLVQYNLFGDPTAPVVSSADWLLGKWNMDHDGWHGVLEITEITSYHIWKTGGYYYDHWHWRGKYTGNGHSYAVTGKLGGYDADQLNAGNKLSRHKIEFNIPFDSSASQYFTGYVFTWERSKMSGETWWENHPFGWMAEKV